MLKESEQYLDAAYVQAVMRHAVYERLEDGTYYGSIPGFQGVWADEQTLEETRAELQSALEDWLLIGISKQEDLPEVDGLRLRHPKASV